MLVRVSCRACRLASIWTDDPASFLETVCQRYRHCEARLEQEVALIPKRPKPAVRTPHGGPLATPRRRIAARSAG